MIMRQLCIVCLYDLFCSPDSKTGAVTYIYGEVYRNPLQYLQSIAIYAPAARRHAALSSFGRSSPPRSPSTHRILISLFYHCLSYPVHPSLSIVPQAATITRQQPNYRTMNSQSHPEDPDLTLKVLSFNVW